MLSAFDVTSIRQKYPNRWLLLIINSYEDGQPRSGRILAHSKHRSKIYDARTKAIAINPDLDLRIIFTGDQRKLDEISPELDLKVAMAEGAAHVELASVLYAEDMERVRLETELKKQQISELETIHKEQRITNTPVNWHNTYQNVAGQQASNQPEKSDKKTPQGQTHSADE